MKITASLSPSSPNLVLPLAALFLGISLLAVGLTIWLGIDAITLRAERSSLEERLAQIETRAREVTTPEALPPSADLAALRQRVTAINALTGSRGWPLPTLLARLEETLPAEVHLVSLQHKRKDGEVLIVAEATNAEALTGFLLKLEKEPHFGEVLLSKQAQRGTPGGKSVQFEVRVRERL
jgi:hypothetical protein